MDGGHDVSLLSLVEEVGRGEQFFVAHFVPTGQYHAVVYLGRIKGKGGCIYHGRVFRGVLGVIYGVYTCITGVCKV